MKNKLFCLLAISMMIITKLIAQNPTIISFTPTSPCQGTSIPVFIAGANLMGAKAVKVGSNNVDSFKVNDSTSITAYISHGTAGKISVTTPKGTSTNNSLFSFNMGHSARAYIPVGNTVMVVDVPADTIITTINTKSSYSNNITAAPDGTKVYILNGNLTVLNTATNAYSTYSFAYGNTQFTKYYLSDQAISPDGTKLYAIGYNASNGNYYLLMINTTTFQLLSTLPLGSTPSPSGVSVSPDGKRVIVLNSGNTNFYIIDAQINTVIATLTLDVEGAQNNSCFSPDGTKAYVVGGGVVFVVDLKNNSIKKTITIDYGIQQICISPDGQKLYLSDKFDNSIKVINTTNDSLITSFNFYIPDSYYQPSTVTLSPDGTQLFVTCKLTTQLVVFNTSTYLLNKTITLPIPPGYSFYGAYGNFVANVPIVCPVPKPVITSFKSPASTGTKDTIKGKAFTGATAVTFGGIAASSFTVVNDSTIIAVVGSGASGFVKVTTLGGSDSLGGFTYNKNLPILITSFLAYPKNNTIKIEWQTACEVNTAKINILHSTDGGSFTEIFTLKAIGSGANSYSFTDNKTANGINYYRLEIVDKDGSTTYSKVLSLQFSIHNFHFSIVPNPAKDFATISFSKAVEKATIAVYETSGKQISTQSISGRTSAYKLNTQSLKSGLYVLKVITATDSYNEKLIIEK